MIYFIILCFLYFLYKIIITVIKNHRYSAKKGMDVKRIRTYIKKPIMSQCEIDFYLKLKELENDYLIIPQVNLASIIDKRSNEKFHTELFRNVDFGIFDKNTYETLLLIELNDRTHTNYSRKKRDIKVRNLCKEAGLKIITFYTSYPNEKNYVINRIKNEIEENKEILSIRENE